jgi:hypothetical protein
MKKKIDHCKIDSALPPTIDAMLIALLTGKAKKTNFIYLFHSYLNYHRQGITPSSYILDKIATAFAEYLASNGKKSLDKCFELSCGKGETPPFNVIKIEKYRETLCSRIIVLVALGNSIDKAVLMVEKKERMQKDVPNLPCVDNSALQANTLKTNYFSFIKQNRIFVELLNNFFSSTSPSQKKAFIKLFPEVSSDEIIDFTKSIKYGLTRK